MDDDVSGLDEFLLYDYDIYFDEKSATSGTSTVGNSWSTASTFKGASYVITSPWCALTLGCKASFAHKQKIVNMPQAHARLVYTEISTSMDEEIGICYSPDRYHSPDTAVFEDHNPVRSLTIRLIISEYFQILCTPVFLCIHPSLPLLGCITASSL